MVKKKTLLIIILLVVIIAIFLTYSYSCSPKLVKETDFDIVNVNYVGNDPTAKLLNLTIQTYVGLLVIDAMVFYFVDTTETAYGQQYGNCINIYEPGFHSMTSCIGDPLHSFDVTNFTYDHNVEVCARYESINMFCPFMTAQSPSRGICKTVLLRAYESD